MSTLKVTLIIVNEPHDETIGRDIVAGLADLDIETASVEVEIVEEPTA